MKFKATISRWIAHRIENRARQHRRMLRDNNRIEFGRIREMDMRSRGLRLYAAWSQTRGSNVVQTTASDWHPMLQPAAMN